MDRQLIVVAEMKAKAGMEAELKRQALAMISPTRAEQGCVQYDLHECEEGEGQILFYEIWASRAAWEFHMMQPYLLNFLGASGDLLSGPARVMTYAKIA
jgi:quinol monooxygenase YgiN